MLDDCFEVSNFIECLYVFYNFLPMIAYVSTSLANCLLGQQSIYGSGRSGENQGLHNILLISVSGFNLSRAKIKLVSLFLTIKCQIVTRISTSQDILGPAKHFQYVLQQRNFEWLKLSSAKCTDELNRVEANLKR